MKRKINMKKWPLKKNLFCKFTKCQGCIFRSGGLWSFPNTVLLCPPDALGSQCVCGDRSNARVRSRAVWQDGLGEPCTRIGRDIPGLSEDRAKEEEPEAGGQTGTSFLRS